MTRPAARLLRERTVCAAGPTRAVCAVAVAALCALRAAAQSEPAPAQDEAADAAQAPALEATVEGERHREPAAEALRGADARDLPGAHGDALVAAQMLPAVARAPVGSGQLVVWGAAPRETRLLVAGIEVPALYHGGGLRSVLPTELVRRLELSPAAFGVQYGRALGGVLAVDLAAPPAGKAELRLSLDPLDAHAAVAQPLGAASLFAGARYSLLDRILGSALSDTARELFPLPRYWDAQLVLNAPLREGETLQLLLFGAGDSEVQSLDASDPALARGNATALRWGRLGAHYRRELDGGAEATAVAWVGDEYQSLRTSSGPAFAAQARWAQTGGLRAAYRTPFAPGASLTIGADALLTHTHLRRSGALTTPSREGDVVAFGEAPGNDSAFDDWTVAEGEAALYASAELTLGPLTLTPGLRGEATATDVSRLSPRVAQTTGIGLSQLEWFAEPRLAIAARAGERLRLFAAAGLHHEAPAPEDLSAVFGAPRLTSASAIHVTAGATLRPLEPLELEATGFLRKLDGLASRSPLPTPQLTQALVQEGTGRALGLQLVARSTFAGPLTGFVSALWSRSERRDLAGGPPRLFDFDQPLSLTAAASYHLDAWVLGGRLRLASGVPRTPVTGAYLDAQSGRYDPIFGAHNAERLPAFAQLDLRVERAFAPGAGVRLRVSLEVQNVLGRSNAADFVYSSDWSSRSVISGLPPAALLGVELAL